MSLLDENVKVRRGNVELDVSRETLEKYLADGFDLVNSRGEVLQEGAPNDSAALKRTYDEQKKKIKTLTEKIEALEKELEAVKNASIEKTEKAPRKTRSAKE